MDENVTGPATVAPLPGLPDRVTVYEVGPRDGLQNESAVVPVAAKAEFVRRLVAAGLPAVELTSFVPPSWIPQLADATELMALVGDLPGRHPVLVPNARGLADALAAGATEVAVFASATETFARRNLNRTVAESLDMFRPVVAGAAAAGRPVRGYVSMCFGDPWEGAVPVDRVVSVVLALAEMGCAEISLGDTIGVATPGQVAGLLAALDTRGLPVGRIAVHFHDTYGQALGNTLATLEMGIWQYDTSSAGLGGCPYAKGATGNVATEDVVYMLHGMGIETGIDLDKLIDAGKYISDFLQRKPNSRAATAILNKRAG